jgi:formylglycine-generating enzyme required for sulfatase activity
MLDAALREKLNWQKWVRLSPAARKDVLSELASQLAADFELCGLTPLKLGAPVPVLRCRRTGLLFHLVPGGRFSLGLADAELEALRCQLAELERERRYASQYDDFEEWARGLGEGLRRLGDAASMRPAHEVELQPFLLARRPLTEREVRAILEGQGRAGSEATEPFREDFELPDALDGSSDEGESEDEDEGEDEGLDAEEDLPGWLEPEQIEPLLAELSARGLRLPSESEWEHACRAGTTTPFPWGEAVPERPTGEPNALGFLDFGYSPELCADRWCPDHQGAPADGRPRPGEVGPRVARGGAGVATPWQGAGEWLALLAAHRESSEENEGYHVIRPARSL